MKLLTIKMQLNGLINFIIANTHNNSIILNALRRKVYTKIESFWNGNLLVFSIRAIKHNPEALRETKQGNFNIHSDIHVQICTSYLIRK